MSAVRVHRFDVSEIGRPTRTPQGFLRVPAYLTRAGVFSYRRADGSVVRELRPPDEVFKRDSLETLSAAPLTDLHPKEMVTPKNVRALAVGVVGESVRQDGQRVAASVTVQDEGEIAMVERGERRELSCGYSCRIDETAGTFDGEAYDQVQRDITYNHVALGPRNWGRAGGDVALRMDSGSAAATEAWCFHSQGTPPERRDDNADPAGGNEMETITIRVDGLDVQVPKQWAQVIEKALKDRTDSIAALTGARDKLQGERDALLAERDGLKTKLTEAVDPKRLDSAIAGRLALVEVARKALGAEWKPEGQTDRQIKEAVIKRADGTFDGQGKSDDYVQARYDATAATLPAGTPRPRTDAFHTGLGGSHPAAPPAPRADAEPYVPPWMQPLAISFKR